MLENIIILSKNMKYLEIKGYETCNLPINCLKMCRSKHTERYRHNESEFRCVQVKQFCFFFKFAIVHAKDVLDQKREVALEVAKNVWMEYVLKAEAA